MIILQYCNVLLGKYIIFRIKRSNQALYMHPRKLTVKKIMKNLMKLYWGRALRACAQCLVFEYEILFSNCMNQSTHKYSYSVLLTKDYLKFGKNNFTWSSLIRSWKTSRILSKKYRSEVNQLSSSFSPW